MKRTRTIITRKSIKVDLNIINILVDFVEFVLVDRAGNQMKWKLIAFVYRDLRASGGTPWLELPRRDRTLRSDLAFCVRVWMCGEKPRFGAGMTPRMGGTLLPFLGVGAGTEKVNLEVLDGSHVSPRNAASASIRSSTSSVYRHDRQHSQFI